MSFSRQESPTLAEGYIENTNACSPRFVEEFNERPTAYMKCNHFHLMH